MIHSDFQQYAYTSILSHCPLWTVSLNRIIHRTEQWFDHSDKYELDHYDKQEIDHFNKHYFEQYDKKSLNIVIY